MPDDNTAACRVLPHAFAPRALRTDPAERRLLEELTERVFALHPAWPWPLLEAEARRRLEAAQPPAAERRA